MKMRKMVGNILIFLSLAFTINLSVIMIHRINTVVLHDSYMTVFRIELFACATFILLALDLRFGIFTRMKPKILRAVGWGLRGILILIAAIVLFFSGKVATGSFIHSEASVKNAIVLGLALEEGKPTDDLLYRLDTAEKFVRDNPDAVLFLTGGNPDESGRTEAAVMHDILSERGISDERMILEDQAASTVENFLNTAKLVDPSSPTVLISSDYHMDRASEIARNAGFSNVLRLPAPSSAINYTANLMWEVVAEINELVLSM